MLRLYTVSFFGHRIIEDFNRAEAKAEALIRELILQKEYGTLSSQVQHFLKMDFKG